jgi:hypothetical protein
VSIALDHVFVCCAEGAPEAQLLLDIGLREGSGNTHRGQGTANRRFFFAGGYLELIWVADPDEARSARTARTRLWERCSGRRAGVAPFGVGFGPTGAETPAPPFPARAYRPQYLPADRVIYFAEGTTLQEPELFYLAWPNPRAAVGTQPIDHRIPLFELLSVSAGLPDSVVRSAASEAVHRDGLLTRYHSENPNSSSSSVPAKPAVTTCARVSACYSKRYATKRPDILRRAILPRPRGLERGTSRCKMVTYCWSRAARAVSARPRPGSPPPRATGSR